MNISTTTRCSCKMHCNSPVSKWRLVLKYLKFLSETKKQDSYVVSNTEFSKTVKFRSALSQTRGKYNSSQIATFTKKCMAGCHTFPCKKRELPTWYFFQFAVELHETHIFAKFGVANLFMDHVVTQFNNKNVRLFLLSSGHLVDNCRGLEIPYSKWLEKLKRKQDQGKRVSVPVRRRGFEIARDWDIGNSI